MTKNRPISNSFTASSRVLTFQFWRVRMTFLPAVFDSAPSQNKSVPKISVRRISPTERSILPSVTR